MYSWKNCKDIVMEKNNDNNSNEKNMKKMMIMKMINVKEEIKNE